MPTGLDNRYSLGSQKGLSTAGLPSYVDPQDSGNVLVNAYDPSAQTGGITLGDTQASQYGLSAGTYTPEQLNTAGNSIIPDASSGGLGNYATITDASGITTNVDKAAYDAIQAGGLQDGLKIEKTPESGLFGLSNETLGTGIAGVNAAVGLASFLDSRKLRKKQMEGIDENIAGARAERSALANYRAAYGA